jgi:hypothetical protein
VTLNITIVAPWGVWQCSDHRVVWLHQGKAIRTDDFSMKQVVMECLDGSALVTYTGLGASTSRGARSTSPIGCAGSCADPTGPLTRPSSGSVKKPLSNSPGRPRPPGSITRSSSVRSFSVDRGQQWSRTCNYRPGPPAPPLRDLRDAGPTPPVTSLPPAALLPPGRQIDSASPLGIAQ